MTQTISALWLPHSLAIQRDKMRSKSKSYLRASIRRKSPDTPEFNETQDTTFRAAAVYNGENAGQYVPRHPRSTKGLVEQKSGHASARTRRPFPTLGGL